MEGEGFVFFLPSSLELPFSRLRPHGRDLIYGLEFGRVSLVGLA